MGDRLREIEVLTCRNKVNGQTCGAELQSATMPMEFTRILTDIRFIDRSTPCTALWCKRCRCASEYRYLINLDMAS